MKTYLVIALPCLVLTGCTSTRLERSVTNQAKTLSDLQYQQVMNNLAMFEANPWAVPAQVGMRDGSAQVADSGSAGFLGQTDLSHVFSSSPTVNGSRSVVEQWGMVPVTEENNLRLLRIAYRRAVLGVDESLASDEELRNKVAHELKNQIAVTEDLRRSTDAYYQSRAARSLSDYYQRLGVASEQAIPPPNSNSIPSELQSIHERSTTDGADSAAARAGTSPGPDYSSFDAQVASANDNCFDCELVEKPFEIAIDQEVPNQGYPVEVRAGRSVLWSNNGTSPVTVSGDAKTIPFGPFHLAPGTKSPPIRFPNPGLGKSAPNGVPYTVSGRTGRTYWLKVLDQLNNCDTDEKTPRRWVITLEPNGSASASQPAVGLTIKEGGQGEGSLTVQTGDFVVWHNMSQDKLFVNSTLGSPSQFTLQVEPYGDSRPLRFSKSDAESGVDGFHYRVGSSSTRSISPEEDKQIQAIKQYKQKLIHERLQQTPDPVAVKNAQDELDSAERTLRVMEEVLDRGRNRMTGVIHVNPQKTKTPLTTEVCRRIHDINKDLTDVHPGWFGHGGKNDVPWKDACYVGHYGDCYTWVCPEGRAALSEFTLTVLSLATTVKESQVVTVPGGPRYSPGIPTPFR